MSKHSGASTGGAVYSLGMIGVFVYFMQQSHSFVDVLVGIAKSIVWPAILTYRIFEQLKF